MSGVLERVVKAVRKAGRCDGCGTMVNVGESAVRWAGMNDGDFSTALYHPECRAAEIALNQEYSSWGSDDWMGLDRDMEHGDHPWLLDKHPTVAARMGITAETIAEREREREECAAAWRAIDAKRRAKSDLPA